jgi:hypothetical protein
MENNNNPLLSVDASQLKGVQLDKPVEAPVIPPVIAPVIGDDGKTTIVPEVIEQELPDYIKQLLGKQSEKIANENNDGGNSNTDELHPNVSAIQNLLNDWGIDPTEIEGVNVESNDLEDIKKIFTKREELIRKEAVTTLRPEVQELHDHLESGKGLDSWNKKQESVNWEAVEQNLKQDDIATLEQIVKNGLQGSNLSDVVIKATIESLKDEDILYATALDFIKKFDAADKAVIKQIEDAEIDINLSNQTDNEKVITTVNDIVKTGTFKLSETHSFNIPEVEKKEFLETILNPEKKNALYDSLTYDQALAVDYIASKIKAGKIGDIKFGTVVKPTVIVKTNNLLKINGNEPDGGELSLERMREKMRNS